MGSKAVSRGSVEARFVRFFSRFPISAVFFAQYLAFVVYPEVRSPTGSAGIIFLLVVVGVGGALWTEVLLSRLAVRGPKHDYRPTRRLILLVFVIGAAASLVALAAGAGTYEVQIGTRSVGAAASLATPFIQWKNFGVWLAIWSSRSESVSKRFALTLFALSVVLDLYLSFVSAIFGSFFATTFVTLVLAVVAGLVRLRSLAIAAVLVALLWPPLFNLRNQRRVEAGANVAELGTDPSLNRLELNKYFVELRVIESGGRRPQVDLLKELRFGFIPRTFDSGRGNLSTANALSIAANLGREELGHVHGVRERLPLERWHPRRTLLFDFGRRARHLPAETRLRDCIPRVWIGSSQFRMDRVWVARFHSLLHSEHDFARFRNAVSSCARAKRPFEARARGAARVALKDANARR